MTALGAGGKEATKEPIVMVACNEYSEDLKP
jgi:hypothetical protein